MFSPMQLIKGLPYQQDKVQQNAFNTFNQLKISPFINGNLIKDIVITSGTPLTISTGLSQAYQIWLVVRNDSNAVIWESTPPSSTQITLNASANTTISIWVG